MTLPTNIVPGIDVGNVPAASDEKSAPSMKRPSAGSEDGRQITVLLNGIIYDAVVTGNAWTVEVEAAHSAYVILPDGDYTLTADVSDLTGSRLNMLAPSAGNNVVASLTLLRDSMGNLPNGQLSISFGAPTDLCGLARSAICDYSVAEPGFTWSARPTRKPSSNLAKISIRDSIGRIVLPSNIVLTPRVLVGAIGKLATRQVEETVEALIDILDARALDPDLEDGADWEAEVDEQSDQIVRGV